MKSILKDFYFGNIRPEEEISDSMQYFKKNLSENDFELLKEMMDLSGQAKAMQAAETFVQGFRMGALTMVEVFEV